MQLKPNKIKRAQLKLTEREIDALKWLDEILPSDRTSWRTLNEYGFKHTGAVTHYDYEIEGLRAIVNQALKQVDELTWHQKADKAARNSRCTLTGVDY